MIGAMGWRGVGLPRSTLRVPQGERPHRPGITLTPALSRRGRGGRTAPPHTSGWITVNRGRYVGRCCRSLAGHRDGKEWVGWVWKGETDWWGVGDPPLILREPQHERPHTGEGSVVCATGGDGGGGRQVCRGSCLRRNDGCRWVSRGWGVVGRGALEIPRGASE